MLYISAHLIQVSCSHSVSMLTPSQGQRSSPPPPRNRAVHRPSSLAAGPRRREALTNEILRFSKSPRTRYKLPSANLNLPGISGSGWHHGRRPHELPGADVNHQSSTAKHSGFGFRVNGLVRGFETHTLNPKHPSAARSSPRPNQLSSRTTKPGTINPSPTSSRQLNRSLNNQYYYSRRDP